MKRFELTQQARADLQYIWEFIARDSFDAANRVLDEFEETFARLAAMPGIGHAREDLTTQDILFWPMYSHLILYKKNSAPLLIVGVLHGRRNLPPILEER